MSAVSERFMALVVERRKERSLSQGFLVEAMRDRGFENFHQTTMSRTEAGVRQLRLDEAVALAEVLDVDLAALVGEGRRERRIAASEARVAAAEADLIRARSALAQEVQS